MCIYLSVYVFVELKVCEGVDVIFIVEFKGFNFIFKEYL